MSRSLIEDTLDEIFRAKCSPEATTEAERDGWADDLWNTLDELELLRAPLPEESGGADFAFDESVGMVRLAGAHAAFVPVAETGLLGGWLLAIAGLPLPPSGLITVAPTRRADTLRAHRDHDGWRVTGAATVPWAGKSTRIAVLATGPDGPVVASIDVADTDVTPRWNLAGEPREQVLFDQVRVDHAFVSGVGEGVADALYRRGALVRALACCGAMETVLRLSVEHTSQREQFGRPLSRFQAVAQQIASIGREVTMAQAAVDLAVSVTTNDPGADNVVEVAVAKTRIGHAIETVGRASHQVHGAMGFTREYALHLYTRRLWAWRDEFGDENEWATVLGDFATGAPDGLWRAITARPGHHAPKPRLNRAAT